VEEYPSVLTEDFFFFSNQINAFHFSEGSEMDWSEEDNTVMSKIEYDCVICSQSSPSTEEKPMGLVVLLQASSIIGHRKRNAEPESLPITEEQRLHFVKSRENTLVSEFVKRGEHLSREFESVSWQLVRNSHLGKNNFIIHQAPWQLALNLGCESGVHVQTCGHHIHLECLIPYLNSLRGQQRQQSLAVDR
jgi:E3 ubiquitin-protein ligase UBR3